MQSLQDTHAEQLKQARDAAATELAAAEARAHKAAQLEREVAAAQLKAQQAALAAEREALEQHRVHGELLVSLSEQVGALRKLEGRVAKGQAAGCQSREFAVEIVAASLAMNRPGMSQASILHLLHLPPRTHDFLLAHSLLLPPNSPPNPKQPPRLCPHIHTLILFCCVHPLCTNTSHPHPPIMPRQVKAAADTTREREARALAALERSGAERAAAAGVREQQLAAREAAVAARAEQVRVWPWVWVCVWGLAVGRGGAALRLVAGPGVLAGGRAYILMQQAARWLAMRLAPLTS